jgi:hypothetical protein
MEEKVLASSDFYPEWLAEALLHGTLPWSEGYLTTLPRFFASYTLHDSSWIGLAANPAYDCELRALVRWDTFWTEGRVPYPGSIVAEWPILAIRFRKILRVALDGFDATDSATERSIADVATTELAPEQHQTTFRDSSGATVEVVHAPPVELLCLDRAGRPQEITGLATV